MSDAGRAPSLDLEKLLAKFDGDLSLVAELAQVMAEDAPQRLAELEAALAAGDATRLYQVAHSLKSAVGNFEAARAYEAARRVEELGRAGELEPAGPAVTRLKAEVGGLLAELERLRAG
jgi:HPt (histidine-containing phosphotransfer) domain-containing protein